MTKQIAIIGCGRISESHIQAIINNNKQAKLSAVCDVVKEKAIRCSEKYNYLLNQGQAAPKIFTDYKEMLKIVTDIDIVSICTESGYHTEIALYCIKHGKHVIVEKPMALSIKDAELMVKTADDYHVKLCVSHQNRFNPSIQKLRKAIEDGRFGRIIAGNARILWNRNKEYYTQAPWRGTYELDGGCLMNQCIHNIDLLQWMLGGEVDWVNGAVGNYTHPYIEAEDYGIIQIKFNNGSLGSIEGTVCVYPKNLEETLTIIGEKGTASIGGLAVNKIETWEFEDGFDSLEEVTNECNSNIENVYGHGHTPLYKDMLEAIEQDRKPYIDGSEGKRAVEIILAAYKSDRENKRVSFPIEDIKCSEFK